MRNFIIKTAQAIAIWAITHLLAGACFIAATLIGIHFEPVLCDQCGWTLMYAIIFGAVISSPMAVLLLVILYMLPKFSSVHSRALFGFMGVLLPSLILITCFVMYFGNEIDRSRLTLFLMPYLFAAELSFFGFARRLIFSKNEEEFETETIDL
jgi:hypothetical protein